MAALFDVTRPWVWLALVAIPVLLLLLPYLAGPLFIYLGMKISGRPTLKEFYLEDPKVPRDTWEYVEDVLAELEPEGFAVLGAYFLNTLVANVRSFVVLIGKRSTCEVAVIAVTYGEAGLAKMRQRHVEFSTSFADGGAVNTLNSQELGAFLPVPGRVTYSLPMVRHPVRLYDVHRAVVRRDRPDGERIWKVGDDPEAYLEKALEDELARQVPVGCLRRSGENYRPTLSTAFRVALQSLWPFKSIALARRRRKAEKLLQELGLDSDDSHS